MADAINATGSLSKTKQLQTVWPDPLVAEPLNNRHTHSFILLHERGGNAQEFSNFLSAETSVGTRPSTFREHFPGARFILPTSKKRRATVHQRLPINKWYDNYSLRDPSIGEELQYEGLTDTNAFLQALIDQEAKSVGYSNIVLGGLSQGCAASLHTLLGLASSVSMHREPIGAYFGMSGWLPFAGTLDPRLQSRDARGDNRESGDGPAYNPFGSESDREDAVSNKTSSVPKEEVMDGATHQREIQSSVANIARDIASLPALSGDESPSFPSVPIFLGHGRNDERVSVELGKQARDVLVASGCRVRWRDYDEGHWYKAPEEIDDIVVFLQEVFEAPKSAFP